jgi:4-hydroxybenzoate polyprenyltransferase
MRDYLMLLRPFTLMAPFIAFLSAAVIAMHIEPYAAFTPMILVGAVAAMLANGASNAVNQIFDTKVDRINKPERPLPSLRLTGRQAGAFSGIVYAASIALSCLVNMEFFLIMLVAVVVTFFYSAPPLRLKNHTVLSNLSIAAIRGCLLFVAGWVTIKPVWDVLPWFIGGIFGLYLLGAATTKDFSDVRGDRAFGAMTLPVKYGARRAAQIISPFFIVPFLLIPVGIYFNVLAAAALPLTCLALYGLYIARLLLRKPDDLTLERNHVSWKHMYLMFIVAYLGFAAAYVV